MKVFKAFIGMACLLLAFTLAPAAWAGEVVIGYTGPLSGPAAEYGQDCANGVELAVKEINAAGGFTVKGQKYTLKLEKLDDKTDPTHAVNNARRIRANGGVAVFNGVFTTIAAMAKVNEEKGNEFLLMAYTSTPKVVQLGNKLLIGTTAPPFTVYLQIFADTGWQMGWRKAGMLVTLGAYGDEWRQAFKEYWTKIGGTITMDKPANYYRETDFSSQLTAILATKPDVMLIGGPSATTALVIEQARSMGYKGGFMLIDQAKPDHIATILKGVKLMENTISVAGAMTVKVPITKDFEKRYVTAFKREPTSESLRNYGAVFALTKSMTVAGTVSDVRAIRAAFPKALPILGDKLPTEIFGINANGRLLINGSVSIIKDGKVHPPNQYFWWPKTQKEWDQIKKTSKSLEKMIWFKGTIANIE